MPAGSRQPVRRILLVGFMAAGKTTVGRILAERLGWRFHDVDERIVLETGRSVADIFQTLGEAAFRSLEAEHTARLLEETEVVISPGGGWAAMSGSLEGLPGGTLSVWLRVSAAEAVRRAMAESGSRPLLAGEDPVGRARELMASREASYRRADLAIDAEDREPALIAADIASFLQKS